MATVKTTAGQYSLNWRDVGLGTIVAAFGAGLQLLYEVLGTGGEINWKHIGIAAATAGVGYLLKNFLTPAKTIVTDSKDVDVTITEK